uniref:limulus clotting factor C n=1 Tax=Lethocerus distinctifemur TaxID=280095 RepID=A0A2K8JRD5_9HEMI|nr:venom S1 protease 23 [Lethocerus distinctifemur]
MGYLSISLLGLMGLAAIGYGSPTVSYLNDMEEEPDSEEFGQFMGRKKTTCKCGWTNKSFGRIVGGKPAEENEYPYLVRVSMDTSWGVANICGGTIVTNYHVLTASHCTTDVDAQYYVTTGQHIVNLPSNRSRMYRVEKVINHPEYNQINDWNDLSVLVIAEKMEFNQFVGPVCLPSANRIDLPGQWVKAAGWGDTQYYGSSSVVLMKVFLKVIGHKECQEAYKGSDDVAPNPIQFCTYRTKKDTCQGDSGGPILWLDPKTNRYTLVGVVSFGIACADGTPAVNTDVQVYMPWILATIKDNQRGSDTSCHID